MRPNRILRKQKHLGMAEILSTKGRDMQTHPGEEIAGSLQDFGRNVNRDKNVWKDINKNMARSNKKLHSL